MRPLGMATVTFDGTLAETFEAIATAGFSLVELFEDDLAAFASGPREAARLAHALGLRIEMFQPFRTFEAMPEPFRSEGFERAERAFDVMGELGAKRLLVCSNVSELTDPDSSRAAADMHELGERAARHGLSIGYEALAWGRHTFDHMKAWEIVRRTDHPQVGLVLDSFHSLARRIPNETLRTIPGEKIAFVQIADAPWLDVDYLQWSRHSRCLPGDGGFDLDAFVTAVLETGYEGPFSLEIFSDDLKTKPPADVAAAGFSRLESLLASKNRSKVNALRRVA